MSIPTPELQQKYAPPLNQNWTRRAYHSSVVIGNWVYIHMGEVTVGTTPFSNSTNDLDYDRLAVNATLSLNLASSWTDPSTLAFQAFPKTDTGVYTNSRLWYDQKTNEAFTFGGELSDVDDDSTNSLSTDKLVPTSDGYGTWTTNSTAKDPPFSAPGLTRPVGGVSAQSDTTAFWLGGYSSNRTSDQTRSLKSYKPTPNLVTYEFATGAWANSTLDPTIALGMANGTIEWAGMEYLPKLGPNGMLVIWGGEQSNTTVYVPGVQPRPMTVIALHDPSTKRWFIQQIDGVAPSARSHFCSVSASDPTSVTNNSAGTHEIFMYGGYAGVPGPGSQQYDEVWALSIPSFTWHQLDVSHKVARSGHTCHIVSNKQMLTIGGVDPSLKDPWNEPDSTNLNGIGIFDLSAATWSGGFDANADAYRRPAVIEDSIKSSGAFPKIWTMQSLASLIINENPNDPTSTTLTGLPPNTNTSIYTSGGGSQISHAGIVAAGTIGGVVAALIPVLILYLYFYHFRPQRLTSTGRKGSRKIFELPGNFSWPKELPAQITSLIQRRRKERRDRRAPGMSSNRTRHELEAGEVAGELGYPSPAILAPARTVTITGGEQRRSGIGDYFSLFRLPKPRPVQPVVVTPNVKEVPLVITPKTSYDGGRPERVSSLPSIPRPSSIFLRPPSFLRPAQATADSAPLTQGSTNISEPHPPHQSLDEKSLPPRRSARNSHLRTSVTIHELEGDSTSEPQDSDSNDSPYVVSPQSPELPYEQFRRNIRKASDPGSLIQGRGQRATVSSSGGSTLPFSPLSRHSSDDDEKEKKSPDSAFWRNDVV